MAPTAGTPGESSSGEGVIGRLNRTINGTRKSGWTRARREREIGLGISLRE